MKKSVLIKLMIVIAITSGVCAQLTSDVVHHFEGPVHEKSDTLFVGPGLLHLSLTNEKRSDKIFYSINNTRSAVYRKPLVLNNQGFYRVVYFLDDSLHAEKNELSFFVDNTPPRISAVIEFKSVRMPVSSAQLEIPRYSKVAIHSYDGGVGIDRINYQLDEASGNLYREPITIEAPGKHVIKIQAIDLLGNTSTSSFTVVTK